MTPEQWTEVEAQFKVAQASALAEEEAKRPAIEAHIADEQRRNASGPASSRATARRVLRAISTHWNLHGYAPSARDIRDALGLKSQGTVSYHLRALRKGGLLASEPRAARTLRLTPAGIKHLEGSFPLERLDEAAIVRSRRSGHDRVHLISAHVACAPLLQAVVEA